MYKTHKFHCKRSVMNTIVGGYYKVHMTNQAEAFPLIVKLSCV